ncbi:MAG: N-acyl-D-amino-acid deacylase family protein [Pseudonocardiaceae bacterium]
MHNPRYRADIAVADGRIAAIGILNNTTAEVTLHADGLIVAPGFVDLHTHYDAQLFWDPYCSISGWHGVTSAVIGNCGFGFAPVHPDSDSRDYAMRTLSRVEQIPYSAMVEALPWTWESFPQWLDVLDAAPKGINILPYLPVNPLLHYVMGRDAAKSRPATQDENRTMAALFAQALDAGACGWSAQRTPPDSVASGQRDFDGTPFASDLMSNDTALALARVMAEKDTGFVQMTLASSDPEADRRHLEELAQVSGQPLVWNALGVDGTNPDEHRQMLAWFAACRERGLRLYCQGLTGDFSILFTLDISNVWDAKPAWRQALLGTREERLAKLSAPGVRDALKADLPSFYPLDDVVLVETDLPEYRQYLDMKLPEIARLKDCHMVDVLLDISLAEDLRTKWWAQILKPDNDLLREIVQDPWVLPGVSDGGAHTKMITAGRYPTQHIETYVRENGWTTLEEMHWKLSALPAHVAGFRDRGTLALGAPADLIVYDYAALRCLPDEIAHDLPTGEWRRIQRAQGYQWILVNGEITFADGKCTGATPGRLLRHGSAASAAHPQKSQ